MRASTLVNVIFIVSICCAGVANGDQTGLFAERDSSPTTSLTSNPSSGPTQTAAGTSAPAAQSTAQASSSGDALTSGSEAASGSKATSSHSSTTNVSGEKIAAVTTVSSGLASQPTGNNGTETKKGDQLPIHPQITPALSVAGVILMLTGLAYTLIGIKKQGLHIFLSTAYLTSLSVTVLIIYVMNPPVKNSIQGAYFIAVFFTGAILGGCSLIFKEVTEGFGCLLGGFCLSMWFLVLRPGGLLQSTSSVAIFIAAFSVSIYCLSFTRHTREYGLIGSTSFSGATAIVLGIDCFSRAGLKEFWLYIWALNDDVFPLGTTSYPITRGIRVEIASVIIIFLLGIISQIKLWKRIKERREKRDATRLEDERQRDEMEEAIGRRLEEGNTRERARWEAVYGDRDHNQPTGTADSGIGTETDTPGKQSISIVETRELPASTETIELDSLGPAQEVGNRFSGTEGSAKTVPVIKEESVDVEESNGTNPGLKAQPQPNIKRVSDTSILSSNPATSRRSSKRVSIADGYEQRIQAEKDGAVLQPPVVVPLPFTVPSEGEPEHESDKSSAATFADSDAGPSLQKNRLSDASIMRKLSGRKAKHVSQSEGDLIIPHNDQSPASSVAATVDDDDMSSRRPSLEGVANISTPIEAAETPGKDLVSAQHPGENGVASRRVSGIDGGNVGDLPSPSELSPLPMAAEELNASGVWKNEVFPDISARQSSYAKSEKRRSRTVSENSARESLNAKVVDQLPSQLSRVVMSYRTNEWAKHISTADPPEFDDLEAKEPGGEPATSLAEPARPVEIKELQQTAMNALPPPLAERPSKTSLVAPQAAPLSRSASNMSKVSIQQQRPSASVSASNPPSRTPSQTSIPKGMSTPNLVQSSQGAQQNATRALRSSSTPYLGQTLATSPIEENVEAVYPNRNPMAPNAGPTLIAQRDSRVRNRHSSGGFEPADSTAQLTPEGGLYSNSNRSSLQMHPSGSIDDDDISLTKRREILQANRPSMQPAVHPPPLTRLSSSRMSSFDSHQPQRPSSAVDPARREAMLASWRESMRQEVAMSSAPQATFEKKRADMMMEKQQNQLGKQHRETEKMVRENVMDAAMRRGDMMEAHKEAIRRMQANANRHV